MRTIINPEYKQYTSFIHQIPDRFAQGGTTIYQGRNEIKVFDIEGTLLNVKQYKVPIWINRLAYTYLRPPKSVRAYAYALKLLNLGFETPRPIASILLKRGGLIERSYFVSLQSPYERCFYEFGEGGIAGREDIIVAFAKYTARLHEAGIYHQDYSPGNILFHKEQNLIYFSLIDLNRMAFGPVSLEKGYRNFARLWGKEDFFRLLAREYATARGADIETATRKILLYRDQFWRSYSKRKEMPFEYD
ncbi:lipopolysaccharide kinase InaA family protein [Parabacteroides sp. Marseille-P3160]|uniref:lipopolysaccharide kinase InaA family protein n=1 Tax=Parabacteroides sp. Marseille-P3160 TaxID=1917887 RepID=UPI0009B94161|nr:lipopolysaccharide kinase InaA family protein [Parabacteroides sp. Marseille-P3160]